MMIGIGYNLFIGGGKNLAVVYREVSDGAIIYRKGYRSGFYVIDYSDDSGATWELNIVVLSVSESSIIMTIDGSPTGYRDQVRSGSYMIDKTLTGTGFSGTENTDWENIIEIKPE